MDRIEELIGEEFKHRIKGFKMKSYPDMKWLTFLINGESTFNYCLNSDTLFINPSFAIKFRYTFGLTQEETEDTIAKLFTQEIGLDIKFVRMFPYG